MADVAFIDASGVAALVIAASRAGELTVIPSPFVRKVLAILSLDGQLLS
jgi:anti-anti-sigma regulatory factor